MYETRNYKQILKRNLKIFFYTFHFLSSFLSFLKIRFVRRFLYKKISIEIYLLNYTQL